MLKNEKDLIVAVLAARTANEAAELAGVSPRTVARRLADRSFQTKLDAASAKILAFSLAPLPRLLDTAIRTLGESLNSKDEKIRLRAAEIALNQAFRYLTAVEYDHRLRRQEDLADLSLDEKRP